ncbi:MAG: hypothetical protein J1F03_01475 [Oscillospiraceae bacterium]|nr:hypothetical protein [Oscillospiraceae bacterium]
MDFWSIIGIVLYIFLGLSALFGVYQFVKLFVISAREGIVAVKYRYNVFSFVLAALLAGMTYFMIQQFNEAKVFKSAVAFLEPLRGTFLVEEFAKNQEKDKGIIILDPDKYYEDYISNCKANEYFHNNVAAFLLLTVIDLTVGLLSNFVVISEKGYRIRGSKDAIPVYAEIDSQKNKIKIKVVDLTGKEQELCKFKATPKNLASLGQFIKQNEIEIQEEQQ